MDRQWIDNAPTMGRVWPPTAPLDRLRPNGGQGMATYGTLLTRRVISDSQFSHRHEATGPQAHCRIESEVHASGCSKASSKRGVNRLAPTDSSVSIVQLPRRFVCDVIVRINALDPHLATHTRRLVYMAEAITHTRDIHATQAQTGKRNKSDGRVHGRCTCRKHAHHTHADTQDEKRYQQRLRATLAHKQCTMQV